MKLENFPIARYQLTFQVMQSFVLPEYAGSALRGVFGRALRRISCMTKLPECKSCSLYRTCPYTNIFETPAPKEHQLQKFSQVPNGYIIEPLEWGVKQYQAREIFKFDLVLFGKLLDQLPLIIFAFQQGLKHNIAEGKAELIDVNFIAQNGEISSILQKGNIIEHQAEIQLPNEFPSSLNLAFSTPLRLQENGKPLKENQISADRFLKTLAKRIALLSEFHAQPLDLDFEHLISFIPQIQAQHNFRWQDWTRYSSRQQQKMKFGGVLGEWQFDNVPKEWAELIYIGQWLHCGKNATFGLGKYQITNL